MAKPIVTDTQKHTPVSANFSTEANALIARQQERDRIVSETYEAVQALNTEFNRKCLEYIGKSTDPDIASLWLSRETEEVKQKTDELWNNSRKMIEELGLRK